MDAPLFLSSSIRQIVRRPRISGFVVTIVFVSAYVWRYQPLALQVFTTSGSLQASKAGGNVQGFFAYHSALFALVGLLLFSATAIAAFAQLSHNQRERELQVVLPILQTSLDAPRLARTRAFVYEKGKDILGIAQAFRASKPHEYEDEYKAAHKAAREKVEVYGENGWRLR